MLTVSNSRAQYAYRKVIWTNTGTMQTTETLVDRLAAEIAATYREHGEAAAVTLRDQLVVQHKLPMFAFAVLSDKLRKLCGR